MPNRQPSLNNRKIDVLFQQSQGSLAAMTAASIIISFLFWDYSSAHIVISWLSAYLLFNGYRHYQIHKYNTHSESIADKQLWLHNYILGAAISGCMWGGIGVYFIHVSPLNIAAIMILLTGYLVIGSAATYAVFLSLYFAFTLPMIAPVIFYQMVQGDMGARTYGILLVSFYAFSIYSALKNHNKETTFIASQYDNQSLLQNLQNEQTEAARLNEELELDLAKLRLAEERLKQEKGKAEEMAEKLLAISTQDGLTGIANRRHFDDFLAKEWNRAVRSRKPLSLILCDIDYFKAYNDLYGHQDGDKCLLRIAHTLDQYARRSGDLAARYGGEEFAIILPETNLANASDIAGQIRNAVQEIAMPHGASETDNIVTASFGVATVIPNRSQQSRMLVALADKALYEAKQKGRNQVVSSTPELVVEGKKIERRS
jgi:diguanylate cyclase (GGDEF)-like protein